MIVVDTNILAYLWLPGPRAAAAEKLLLADSDWNAPLLWRSEFRSILAGYLRRGDVTMEGALRTVADVEEEMTGREFDVPSADVLRLVQQSACSAYDCEFVALARDLGVPLVTSDKAILKAFPAVARALQ